MNLSTSVPIKGRSVRRGKRPYAEANWRGRGRFSATASAEADNRQQHQECAGSARARFPRSGVPNPRAKAKLSLGIR
jgi:hypothetical protein